MWGSDLSIHVVEATGSDKSGAGDVIQKGALAVVLCLPRMKTIWIFSREGFSLINVGCHLAFLAFSHNLGAAFAAIFVLTVK